MITFMSKHKSEHPHCFPGGKSKALTFGFDDGEIYDRRLAQLFRKYGMSSAFFLITDSLGTRVPFCRYGKDIIVERVSAGELSSTYDGMEIASHTASHHDCTAMSFEMLKKEIERSCLALHPEHPSVENVGLAYPGGAYNAANINSLKRLSVPYARTAFDTHTFTIPSGQEEFLAWNPTCRYNDPEIDAIINRFLDEKAEEPLLLYIRGHSYELEAPEPDSGWNALEERLKRLSFREDIWYASNIELYREVIGWNRSGN